MADYTPVSALEGNFELYNVVYEATDVDLEHYFKNRNSLKWVPYAKIDDGDTFKFVALPKATSSSVIDQISKYKLDYNGSPVYALVQDMTFTLILFDSRDHDSELCKDIVAKQYTSAYGRDISNWKTNGIVIYDLNPEYEGPINTTIDGHKYFDLNCLRETKVDEVFLCGYYIDSNLFRQFARSNEKIYVFESNPYKINLIRSTIKSNYDVHFCMTKNKTKAYQAYTLFRDPIGNIKPEDNPGLNILKQYSDIKTFSFTEYNEWKYLEKVKIWFEKNVQDNTWRDSLINILFGEYTSASDASEALKENKISSTSVIAESGKFRTALENYSCNWTNNIVAINTRETPTFNDINDLITESRKYDQIVTFYKNDSDFWVVKVFKADRPLTHATHIKDAKSIDEATKLQNVWYTANGIPVVKVDNINEVLWYNMSGRKPVPANLYELNPDGDYVFDTKNRVYVKFKWSSTSPSRYPMVNGTKFNDALFLNNTWQVYKLNDDPKYITFDTVYPDTIDINFNNLSMIETLRNRFYCQGNKFLVEASLTDRQMYECLKTKSLIN